MAHYYILEGKIPVPVEDVMEWAAQSENINRGVAFTKIEGVQVSTVFLGINYQFGEGNPLLFETMIFSSDEHNGYMERYTTWEEAEKGHLRAVKMLLE